MKKAFVLAVLLCLHTPALAAECYTKPAPPASLLEAIARQESGLNPLVVNIAGKSYYPATREEAERLIRQAITAISLCLVCFSESSIRCTGLTFGV